MPRLSCNQLSTYRWTFEEDLYHYRQAGYHAIGVWRRKLQEFGVERGLDLLYESGLAVSTMTWAGGFTGIDGRRFQESVADAIDAVRLAKQAQAKSLIVYTGGRNGHTPRHARRLVLSALQEVLPLAEALGVTLALKPMHPACATEWSILTTLQETFELIAQLGSSRLGIAYDTYQFPLSGAGLEELTDLTPAIALVQLADAHTPHGVDLDRCCLGDGRVPVEQILHTLLAAGYDGYFDLELMGPSLQQTDYGTRLASGRQVYDAMVQRAPAQPALVGARRE